LNRRQESTESNGQKDHSDKIRLDNERVFSKIFDDYFIQLAIFTEKYVNDLETAENIVADMFKNLWQLRKNFDTLSDVRAYMYVSCRNNAYHYNRDKANKKFVEHLTDNWAKFSNDTFVAESGERDIIENELLSQLYKEIDLLTPQRKDILHLTLAGYSNIQIADVLNLPQGAVRTAKYKAILELRKKLKRPDLMILFYAIIELSRQ
jgi:RNA polymerase sigma factor (sigma-70 family)